ncbi:Hypothetical predicted protein [Octopus vulgaris]|uniref:Uncharacterized protein n=1 Tax=Octopus vulgaris TaxID=6645 RepID=A0AA36B6G6_OCTVU|nr:Hypothetical predicted protein [Octopus vulgaris]
MKWSRVNESMYREMYGSTVKKNFQNFYKFFKQTVEVMTSAKLIEDSFNNSTNAWSTDVLQAFEVREMQPSLLPVIFYWVIGARAMPTAT